MSSFTFEMGFHGRALGSQQAGGRPALKDWLNPYLNFHRPCGVPQLVVNAKGKEKRVYRWYATPWAAFPMVRPAVTCPRQGADARHFCVRGCSKLR